MDYELSTTKKIWANVGPRYIKQFLNPPMVTCQSQKKMAGKPLARKSNQVQNINEKQHRAVFN